MEDRMRGIRMIAGGLVSLMLGATAMVAPVAADDPPLPAAQILFEQVVDRLPSGPLCWNVVEETVAAGARVPGQGYHGGAPHVIYVLEGETRLEYAGGAATLLRPASGAFVGNDNWHARTNPGTTPARALVFTLTCEAATAGPGRTVRLASSGPLAGVRPDAPYLVRFQDRSYAEGAQTPVQMGAGPQISHVLAGNLVYSTPAGLARHQGGDFLIIPTGTPRQVTNLSGAAARTLVIHLYPASDPVQVTPASVTLPSPAAATPAALPRTGDSGGGMAALATLAGMLLLAVGLRVRRAAR